MAVSILHRLMFSCLERISVHTRVNPPIDNQTFHYLSASAFTHTSVFRSKAYSLKHHHGMTTLSKYNRGSHLWCLCSAASIHSVPLSCASRSQITMPLLFIWKTVLNLCSTVWAGQDFYDLWTASVFPLPFIDLLHSEQGQFSFLTSLFRSKLSLFTKAHTPQLYDWAFIS